MRRARRGSLWILGVALLACAPAPAPAQGLPSEPVSLANGRFVLGAEVSATMGSEDPGFFNYTDYEYSALRNVRLGVSAEVRANDHIQVLGEVRLDQGRYFEAYGLYVRVRPWPARRFDIQAGRVPPTFGALARSAYGNGNLLVGQPLSYQYLMSIRPDAIPANADDLLRMRGRGWLSDFPVGNTTEAPGLPLVNTTLWDTGVQAHGVYGVLEWTAALTTGSLSDPQLLDNNAGRQLAGRLVARPSAAWALGLSAARGDWLDESLDASLPSGTTRGARQVALGGDAEFSSGPVLVRGEVIRSEWTMPAVSAPFIDGPLVAVSLLAEGRYKVAPGVVLALRGERLDFSTITGTVRTDTWEADTWRMEAGGGYSLTRNIQLKGSWQRNRRDGGRVRRDTLITAQVLYWF
jgi:hypothetical protein